MTQSKLESLIETCLNTAIGFVVALLSQIVVFPLVGIHVPFSTNIEVGAWFTVISVARGYVVRRWFNARLKRAARRLAQGVRLSGSPAPQRSSDRVVQAWRRSTYRCWGCGAGGVLRPERPRCDHGVCMARDSPNLAAHHARARRSPAARSPPSGLLRRPHTALARGTRHQRCAALRSPSCKWRGMMPSQPNPTIDRVRQLFDYDPITGLVRRKIRVAPNAPAGDIVGTKSGKGYLFVGIDYRHYMLHRIVWALHYGEWPTKMIDHLDGDGSNNAITNLRDVGYYENANNTHRNKLLRAEAASWRAQQEAASAGLLVSVSDAQIKKALDEVDSYCRDVDNHEYGIPLYEDHAQILIDRVRSPPPIQWQQYGSA